MERKVSGPFRGAANNSAFINTPLEYAPLSAMRNMLVAAPVSDRPRFGQRDGSRLRFPQQLGNGSHVQAFGIIQRSSGTSDYERNDVPAATMDATFDSRVADSFERYAGAGTGRPRVAFVMDPNFAHVRPFGFVEDSAVAIDRGRPQVSIDTANIVPDILTEETDQAPYNEDAAANHQVIMGLQLSWHPRAGVSGDANENTLIFMSLVSPIAAAGPPFGAYYTSVTAVNAETGLIKWRQVLKDRDPGGAITITPGNIIANSIVVDTDYTYISAGWYVYVLNTETGVYLQRTSVDGWAQEIQNVILGFGLPRQFLGVSGPWPPSYAGKTLRALFTGTNGNNTTGGQSFQDNSIGTGPLPAFDDSRFVQALAHWRSGVAEYLVKYQASGLPLVAAGTVLERYHLNPADQNPAVAELWNGVAHNTLRFSSVLARNPRGGVAYASCGGIDPFTSASNNVICNRPFFVGITNRGYGVTASPAVLTNATLGTAANWAWPNSAAAPTNVVAFNGSGVKQWEIDTQTILATYNPMPASSPQTWQNDIPTVISDGGPEATVMAMVADDDGNVYTAGKRNSLNTTPLVGNNVFKIEGTTGRILWRHNLAGIIYQQAICVDPTDGNILLAGLRNQSWDGVALGVYAFLYKLSSVDGSVLRTHDMLMDATLYASGADANGWLHFHQAFGVSVDARGRVAFVTSTGI